MADSQIEQTKISGDFDAKHQVVEIVRAALTRAAELLDGAVPSGVLDVPTVKVGVQLDPSDPKKAAESLAHLIALEALKQAPEPPKVPSDLESGSLAGGITVAPSSPVTTGSPPSPKAILLDPSFSGGVRGQLTDTGYRRKSGDSTLSRIDKKLKGALASRNHLFDTKLAHKGVVDDFVLVELKQGTDDPLIVRVYSDAGAPPRGPHSAHGDLTGPVRFFPTLNDHGRLVGGRIGVDRDLHQSELIRALGNQIDLLAGLLHDGHLTKEALRREMRSEQMQGERGSTATTAMDVATVQELDTAWRALQAKQLRPELQKQGISNPTDIELAVERVKVLNAKLKAWGLLGDDQHIGSRVEFLEQHLNHQTLNQILGGLYFSAHTGSALKSLKLTHLVKPEDSGNSRSWVGGGHQDNTLKSWVAKQDHLVVVETSKLEVAGQVLRSYAQFSWIKKGTPPDAPGSTGYPKADSSVSGGVSFDASKWQRSSDDKTTFENLMTFLEQVESAWSLFLKGGGVPGKGGIWSHDSADGVPVKGYARKKTTKGTGAVWYDFSSVFPDASKI